MPTEFPLSRKQLIGAVIFAALGTLLAGAAPTAATALVVALLLLTVYLFAFEVVGVDVAAATIMVLIGLTELVGPWFGLEKALVPGDQLFKGFSSNAVISIIAVMIIGAGLDKTGLMGQVAGLILKVAGRSESRIIPAISGTVAFISSFMQNVGAAALFLPVVNRVAARTGLPMSRLLMPMGFCAILGGTITMVGSSPLILLNDLILNSNKALPEAHQMATWSMFSVTPIGIALVVAGISYFVLAGRYVLPAANIEQKDSYGVPYLKKVYGMEYALTELIVPASSPLVGLTLDDVETAHRIRVVAFARSGERRGSHIDPGVIDRDLPFHADSILCVHGEPDNIERFARQFGLEIRPELFTFAEALAANKAGDAEIVIPPVRR